MRFVADEGVDKAVVEALRGLRYDVLYIAEAASGLTDRAVLQLAHERRALLITADKDFSELVFRLRQLHSGIILLRLMGLSSRVQATLVAEAVKRYGEAMRGGFTVIAPETVRIRPNSLE